MAVKDFLDEQYSMIEDVKDTTFEYSNTTVVPLVSDSGLTYAYVGRNSVSSIGQNQSLTSLLN